MLGIVFLTFIVAMVLGLPMAVAIGFATFAPQFLDASFKGGMEFIIVSVLNGLNTTPILAIPLFMFSGALMTRGGISRKLFDIFAYIAGTKTAGLPCAVVLTCLFYGAISGSSPATTAAVGAMCIPILIDLGYDKVFAAAVVATAGGLGVIIPPSIPFIMYALFTGESIGAMFQAGIIPGCLIALSIMICCYIYCKRHGEDKEKIAANFASLKERGFLKVLADGFWAVLTPVFILGGIYGGIVTPTEAACVSVIYALLVCLFIYRTLTIRDIPLLMKDAIGSYASICLLIGLASGFGKILILLRASDIVENFLTTAIHSSTMFLIAMNIMLLILGMFLDGGAAIIILAPILAPVAKTFGINGVHLGVVMVVNLAIGFVTPPFGVNLFVAAPLVDTGVATLGKKALPFIGAFILSLVLITFIEPLSMFLVG